MSVTPSPSTSLAHILDTLFWVPAAPPRPIEYWGPADPNRTCSWGAPAGLYSRFHEGAAHVERKIFCTWYSPALRLPCLPSACQLLESEVRKQIPSKVTRRELK